MNKPVIYKNNKVSRDFNFTLATLSLPFDQLRLLLSVISLVRPEDTEFQRYQITLKNYSEALGVKVNSTQVHEALQGLFDRSVKVHDNPKEPKEYKLCKLIEQPHFRKDKSVGWVFEMQIDQTLKPYLLNLKNGYTSIQLETISKMMKGLRRGDRVLAFYDILNIERCKKMRKDEKGVWHYRNRFPLNYEELNERMGFKKKAYASSHFKERIIEPCKKRMDEFSDWSFEYKSVTGMNGRTVEIDVICYDNTDDIVDFRPQLEGQQMLPLGDESDDEIALQFKIYERLKEWGIKPHLIRDIQSQHRKEKIIMTMDILEEDMKSKKKVINNPAGYLMDALKNNYYKK